MMLMISLIPLFLFIVISIALLFFLVKVNKEYRNLKKTELPKTEEEKDEEWLDSQW
jgi:predicted permease